MQAQLKGLTNMVNVMNQEQVCDAECQNKRKVDNLRKTYIKAKQNNLKIIRFPVKFNKKIKNYGIRSNDTFIKNIKNSLNQIIGGFYLFFKYI